MDKLAENYYDSSPYVYCVNNPIKLIDVDGRYFDDKNEKRAKRIEKRLNRKLKRLNRRIKRKSSKGKDIGDLEARTGQLNHSLNDIADMRSNKNTEFKYASLDSKDAKSNGVVGPTAMQTGKNNNGNDVVTMFNEKNMGSILHEGRHGGDIARGNLEFNTTGGYTVSHEVSAYKAQYAWSGSFSYDPFVDFSNQANLMKLTGGIKSFRVTIKNMNNITPKVVNSLVDKPGLMQQLIYPPKDANGNPLIPLNIWNR